MITCCRRCGAPDTPGIRGRGKEPPPQAWRRRAQPHLHPQRAPHRLPDAAGWNRRIADHAVGVVPLWCPLRLLAGPRQHQGVRGAPGGSPGPLGLDSVCSSRYVVMLRKVRISLSRMACLETFRGLCPRGILDGYPVPQNFHQGRWVPAGSASSRDSMYRRKLSSSHMLGL